MESCMDRLLQPNYALWPAGRWAGERRRSHCVPPGPQRQPMAGTRGRMVCVRRPGGAASGRKAVGESTVVGAVVAVDKRRDESAHLQCGVLARLGDHTRPHCPLGRQQRGVGRRARPSAALERACGWPWPAACATACRADAAGSAAARPSPHHPSLATAIVPLVVVLERGACSSTGRQSSRVASLRVPTRGARDAIQHTFFRVENGAPIDEKSLGSAASRHRVLKRRAARLLVY